MVELLAPAKLTVSLRVTGVRSDGYHLIDAEMVSLDLADRLTLTDGDGFTLEAAEHEGGLSVPDDEDNLVVQALRLAGRRAHVRLQKRIPSGAGLGGGSADAAAVLRWAGVTDPVLASRIGADVAFCLVGGRARVTGIGEEVVPLPFVARTYTLLTPPLACPTPAVYRRWDELGGPVGDAGNDLEPAAIDLVPELVVHRDRLADHAGVRPRLAGSGSTWFVDGAFPGPGFVVVHTVPASNPTVPG